MSFGPHVTQAPPAAPPPPPPPATPASSSVQASYAQEQQKAMKDSGKGFGGTLLTSPQGAPKASGAANTLGGT